MSIENISANPGESEQKYASNSFGELAKMPDFFEFRSKITAEKIKQSLEQGSTTAAAYIEGGDKMSMTELRKKKGDPEAYTKERQAWHNEVINGTMEAARHLSEQLGDPPRIIAARGSCGSGKTTTFKELFDGLNVFDEKFDIPGAIKPDYFKDVIKKEAKDDLGINITSTQAHMESTGLCRMYADKIKTTPNLSMVVDKQLGAPNDIKEIIDWGKESGKKVELIDNDVPLELSAYRVLRRRVDGVDPNIDFAGVARGFTEIRANRMEAIEDARDDIVSDYSLRVFDPVSKQQVEVMKKIDGKIVYIPGYEDLAKNTIFEDETSARIEVMEVRDQLITAEYVENFISKYFDESNGPTKWSSHARKVLGAYVGLGVTLGEALDSKDAGIDSDYRQVDGVDTDELVDPSYREKVLRFVAEKRALAS